MDSLRASIFLMTSSNVALEKVEATYNKEAMGFSFPILASCAKAPSILFGLIVCSFSMIKLRASRTPGP